MRNTNDDALIAEAIKLPALSIDQLKRLKGFIDNEIDLRARFEAIEEKVKLETKDMTLQEIFEYAEKKIEVEK